MKWLLKKLLKRESALYQLLKAWYRFYFLVPRRVKDISVLLVPYNSYKNGSVRFVQIGSNDGMSGDPLHAYIMNYPWTGILVEPEPVLFARLKKNYEKAVSKLTFENVAISREPGLFTFYKVDNSDGQLPEWTSQLGSFDKTVILKHSEYIPAIAERITAVEIPADSFNNLLSRHQVQQVDLVHIDTEGHDFDILQTIDLAKYHPGMIIYEQKHLPGKKLRASVSLLRKSGYKVSLCKSDCIAVHKSVKPGLSA